jgi:hypothetical protein
VNFSFKHFTDNLIFAPQNLTMDYQEAEYHEELQKVQDKDFTHSWVSSSAFIFYLSVFCFLAFVFGAAFFLYHKRFENSKAQNVVIQGSTLYTPKYSSTPAK